MREPKTSLLGCANLVLHNVNSLSLDVNPSGSHVHFWDPETSWINAMCSISGGNMVAGLRMIQTNRGSVVEQDEEERGIG